VPSCKRWEEFFLSAEKERKKKKGAVRK